MHAKGHLLGIRCIEERCVLLQMNLDQPLLTLVSDHVSVGTDEFHRFRIAKPDQRNASNNLAVQRQFDQLGVFVGDGEQAFAHRIEGQRRNIVVQPLNDSRLDRHLILIQAMD